MRSSPAVSNSRRRYSNLEGAFLGLRLCMTENAACAVDSRAMAYTFVDTRYGARQAHTRSCGRKTLNRFLYRKEERRYLPCRLPGLMRDALGAVLMEPQSAVGDVYAAQLERACSFLWDATHFTPQAVIVLGSGLGKYADKIEAEYVLPYADVPGWPLSTAPGHEGRLILGVRGGVKIAAFAGRFHIYEGYTAAQTVLPLRSVLRMGAKKVLLTNAAGAIRPGFRAGSVMIVTDHINLTGENPLTGPNVDSLGVRFPDMTHVYSARLAAALDAAAAAHDFYLERGVYAYMHGPSYETPAEIRALRVLGADAVGMSTVPEAVASVHAGAEVAALSVLSNLAAGVGSEKLSEQEVLDAADKASDQLEILADAFIADVSASVGAAAGPPTSEE